MNSLKPSPRYAAAHNLYRSRSLHAPSPVRRQASVLSDHSNGDAQPAADVEADMTTEEDPTYQMLKERWSQSEGKIDALFAGSSEAYTAEKSGTESQSHAQQDTHVNGTTTPQVAKKPARQIEDDYGDDEDDEDEDAESRAQSPLLLKSKASLPNGIPAVLARSPSTTTRQAPTSAPGPPAPSVEEVRRKLEQDKKMAEESAKRNFHTRFFTLESDRDTMLEQQKLDELDRQVADEMGDGTSKTDDASNGLPGQGSLSSADLGASSLTLKNLIARIDARRNQVQANDAQLRHLISEVRKGRSKWASEDKVNQEELYEAAEKVLMELKAMTEYSTPFLQRVNKRDAPDYYHVIKQPMDMGTMIKKLKGLQYKSKQDFVNDLSLIWTNCLKYNNDPNHPLRKKALFMRKETDKLVPLIPDVSVRDRAEVEAEERRNQGLENDVDGGEDSDDDRPIIASRGRKAPSKGKKGGPNGTTDTNKVEKEATPLVDAKPNAQGSSSHLRNEYLRGESDAPGEHLANGHGTPPPGGVTQLSNGVNGSGSQADFMDVDSVVQAHMEEDEDDAEHKTWKQVTKKDRAVAASDRHKLFRGDQLNPEEPALLRSKAGMRRWTRQQKQYLQLGAVGAKIDVEKDQRSSGETLAEGIEKDSDKTLPDYYELLTTIPGIADHLQWREDDEGNVVDQEAFLKLFPANKFVAEKSKLNEQIDANMRQMQNTRKVCAKIGYVKQLQVQYQTYQNQFPKYDPLPFVEQDIPAVAVSEEGPIMAPWVCRAALQRSVGKLFYHAGFEDFQPAALDAATDVAADFFGKLIKTFTSYSQIPRSKTSLKAKYTFEEQILHALFENGLDLDGIESYMKEEMDRLGTKLGVVHERLRMHLADILRPALADDAGPDGAGAFKDGSEQFVAGDFADDINEDFFGFRELGLLEEFGMEHMAVPLHLLQNRLHAAHNAQHAIAATSTGGDLFPAPEPYAPVSTENVTGMIGLAQDFFASRLAANHGRALVDDEDLPPKQRFPKPRLAPTGKISSPRKRPLREQQQAAKKKKRKLEEQNRLLEEERKKEAASKGGDGGQKGSGASKGSASGGAIRPLKLQMPDAAATKTKKGDPEKDASGMMSPESIVAP